MPVKSLGSASVSVEADTGKFGNGLAAKLRVALEGTEKEAKKAGKRIGREIIDGITDEIRLRTPLIKRRINAMLRGITVKARVKVDVDVDEGSTKTMVGKLAGRLRGNIEAEATGGLFSAIKSFRNLMSNVGSNPLAFSIAVSVLAVAATAAAGAVNAVGTQVLNLVKGIGYLPAGISVAAATAISLKLALSGVNDALSAVFSRDPEKLKEALKSLTPAARSFVLEVQKALPVIDRIKAASQQRFFGPLEGVITSITKALGPTVLFGIGTVSEALGALFARIGTLFSSEKVVTFLTTLFQTTGNIINTLAGPITHLISAFISMAQVAFPGLEGASTSVGQMIDKFATWIETAVADGRFQKWLDDAKKTLGDVKDLVSELTGLFGALFDGANEEGGNFLTTSKDLIKSWKDFANSKDGELAMDGMKKAAEVAGIVLMGCLLTVWLVTAAVGSLIGAITIAIRKLDELAERKKSVAFGLRAFGGFGGGLLAENAEGSVVRRPIISTLAEDGPEVVIPLTKPSRARQLLNESGLDRMFGNGGGNVTNIFYLGEEQIQARMVQTVDSRINTAVTDAAYGTRAA